LFDIINKDKMSAPRLQNYYILKLIKFSITYLSSNIANNYMSQIYTDYVLVNNMDPPNLINLVWLFIGIDFVMNLILMGILFGLAGPVLTDVDMKMYMIEYLIVIVIMGGLLLCVATTMNSKKYFLYKDDGLRAIRALTTIIQKFNFINFIPFLWVSRNADWYKSLMTDIDTTEKGTGTTGTVKTDGSGQRVPFKVGK
jgi:hypothetical protein